MGNRLSIKINNQVNYLLKVSAKPNVGQHNPSEYKWEIYAMEPNTVEDVSDWRNLDMTFIAKVEKRGHDGSWQLLHEEEVGAYDEYIITEESIEKKDRTKPTQNEGQ